MYIAECHQIQFSLQTGTANSFPQKTLLTSISCWDSVTMCITAAPGCSSTVLALFVPPLMPTWSNKPHTPLYWWRRESPGMCRQESPTVGEFPFPQSWSSALLRLAFLVFYSPGPRQVPSPNQHRHPFLPIQTGLYTSVSFLSLCITILLACPGLPLSFPAGNFDFWFPSPPAICITKSIPPSTFVHTQRSLIISALSCIGNYHTTSMV